MSILSLIFFSIFALVLWLYLRYPRECQIFIETFPRDVHILSVFIKTQSFGYYIKYMNMTASKYFDKTVSKNRMKVCFLFEDELWTFKKVQEESFKIAKYFKDAGYRKGDVVGLYMENRPEYVCIWLGLGRLGVVTSLLNYNIRLNSLKHCIQSSKCKGLIYGTELTSAIQDLMDTEEELKDLKLYSLNDRTPPSFTLSHKHINLSEKLSCINKLDLDKEHFGQVNGSDMALHIFTSGTTGMPKAVLIKHNRLFSYSQINCAVGMDPDKDIVITPIPLYHIQGGLIGVSCAIFNGVTQVILRKFSATQFWKQCIKYDATYAQYLGEIIRYLYNQPETPEEKLHKVHSFIGNGVNIAIWEKFVKRFKNIKIKEMYGSTEGNCSLINVIGHIGAVGYVPQSIYKYLPFFLAKKDPITGDLLRDLKTKFVVPAKYGEPGEVIGKIVQGNPYRQFNGYTDEQATNEKIAKDVMKKGDIWFRTGDIFTMDEYGYFYFKDRTGDTFKWKGENVSTIEVEQVVAKASDYRGVTVYGVEVPGNEGKCGMVTISAPEGQLDLDKLAGIIIRYLPSYARPMFLRIYTTEIQMTGTFKLQKIDLQREAFNIEIIKDPMYFLKGEKYVLLEENLYNDIIEGRIRF